MSAGNQYIYQRVWEIHETLHPKPDDLVSTARFFVREGELQLWDPKKKKKKKRYFFLFNDIVLLCRRENQKRYWLRIHITLRSPHVTVEEIDNSSFNNEFRLHCRSRSFMLYAPTPEARKEWVEDLRRSIQGTHPEEKKDKDKDKPDEKEERRKSIKKMEKPIKKEAKKPVKHDDDSDESDDEDSPESEEETPKTKRNQNKDHQDTNKTPHASTTKGKKNKKLDSTPHQTQGQPFDPFGPTPNTYGVAGMGAVGVSGIGGGGMGVGGSGYGVGGLTPGGGYGMGMGVGMTPSTPNNLQRIQTNAVPYGGGVSPQPNPFFPANQAIISAPQSNPFSSPSPYNPSGMNTFGINNNNTASGAGITGGYGVGVSIGGVGGGLQPPYSGQNLYAQGSPQVANPFLNQGGGSQQLNPFAPPTSTPANPFLNPGTGGGNQFTNYNSPNPF